MPPLIGIYGASGCGRGIMPLARELHHGSDTKLVFVDDGNQDKKVNGIAVLSFHDFCAQKAEQKMIAIAIAHPATRASLAERLDNAGISLATIRASNIVVMDDVMIGEGALVSPFVTFTSNIKIGRCFHANLYSYVEHDCLIGNFVTFAPAVRCNGNVIIGDRAYIGSGAVIRQGVSIGADAVVGMGAVVTKDVAPGTTVIGNPASPMKIR